MKKTLSILMAFMFMFCAGTAFAERGPGGKGGGALNMPRGPWWNRPETVSTLKLSDEQVEKLNALYTVHRNDQKQLRSDRQVIEVDLVKILSSAKPDYAKANTLIDKFETMRSKLSTQRMKTLLSIRKILTQKQYLALKSMKKQKGGRGMGGRGRKGGGGEPGPGRGQGMGGR